jgi:hypothetical protein
MNVFLRNYFSADELRAFDAIEPNGAVSTNWNTSFSWRTIDHDRSFKIPSTRGH